MSFVLKAGYDSVYKHIVNVSLKKTTIWNRGSVMVNGVNINIDSNKDNRIEMIKYNDMNTLMLNNAIIYENRRLFNYDIDLQYNFQGQNNFSKKNLYNYIDFNIVNYKTMENIISQRTLN